MPSCDDKLDEYFCIIACNNSMAEKAIIRAFPPIPSRTTFKYIAENADKVDLNYIDPITARVFVSLTSIGDLETAALALECLTSIAKSLGKQKTASTDENEKKKYQNHINKILSDNNCQVIVKFAKSVSSVRKQGSKEKAALVSVSNYINQFVVNNIPFTKAQGLFDIMLSFPSNSEMMKANLPPFLESNVQTATSFLQWLSVPENMQNLSFETFSYLVGLLKVHKGISKDVKNVIALAKSNFKNKANDLKKLEKMFN